MTPTDSADVLVVLTVYAVITIIVLMITEGMAKDDDEPPYDPFTY